MVNRYVQASVNTIVDYALTCPEPQVADDLARLLCLLIDARPHLDLKPPVSAEVDQSLTKQIGRACLLMHERCEFEVERAIVQLGLLRMAS